jgi:hypothetical protein
VTIASPHINTAQDALLTNTSDNTQDAVIYGLGGLSALVGDNDQALNYLRQAVLQNERVIGWACHDIAWLNLRNDPRFLVLIIEAKKPYISILKHYQ